MVAMISAVNDLVVKFANVNGSGSASANELFAKSVLRMGVPVSTRNIFPSNIQGLPTWFEVRISEQGWLGRRGGVDLMVAMNPQSWNADLKEIEPGGYLFYDNSHDAPGPQIPEGVNAIGVPLTNICAQNYSDARQRQLFKNIMYVGALAALLDMDMAAIETVIGEQYRRKEKLLQSNVEALRIGHAYAKDHLTKPFGLKVKRADVVGDRIFIDGNHALSLGFVYGGATLCAWYPITPSSSVAESFQDYCAKMRVDAESGKKKVAIIQAEDELASIGMVIGAAWNGARAFTATAGPGISLMQEFIGLAYFAEIPATIVDVQRGGPSTGMPSRTQQSDIMTCAYASHGDTKHVLLLPGNSGECFEDAAMALDLADRLQTPVFIMTDLDIGMNQALTAPFQWDDARRYDRGKVMTAEMLNAGIPFARYRDVDGDGIPYRTYPGTHPTMGSFFTRGTTRNAAAQYSEAGADYIENVQRLLRKFDTAKTLVPPPILREAREKTAFGAIFFGSTASPMAESIAMLEERDLHLDTMRLRAFPFPEQVRAFIEAHERIFVVEQNRDGQMRALLINELSIAPSKLISVLHYDGTPITARFITDAIAHDLSGLSQRKAG